MQNYEELCGTKRIQSITMLVRDNNDNLLENEDDQMMR